MSRYIQILFRGTKAKIAGSVGLLAVPGMVFADSVDSLTGIFAFFQGIQGVLNVLLPLLVSLALLAFFWGLVQYLWSAGDAKQRDAGKALMIWGVIALFVMVSIWGLTTLLQRLFLDGNMDYTATDYSGGGWRNGSGGGGSGSGAGSSPPPPSTAP